jgi:hypothetical protein
VGITGRAGVLRETRMLIEATEEAGAEGRARRILLDLYEQTMDQTERWVLVDTLKRRLWSHSVLGVDVGVAFAYLNRWIELEGPARMTRVRLTDVGRSALGLRVTQRSRPSKLQAKSVVITPSATVRH